MPWFLLRALVKIDHRLAREETYGMSKAKISLLLILVSVMISAVLLSLPYVPAVRVHTVEIGMGMFAESFQLAGVVGYDQEQILFSPIEGRVDQIYVSPGQNICRGDMIFRLDTSQAEKAIADLTAMNVQYEAFRQKQDSSVLSLVQMQNYEIAQTKQKLLMQIESSQIRSELDGMVGEVFLQEGQYVNASMAVGRIRSDHKCVWVTGEGRKRIQTGTAAVLKQNGVSLGTAVFDGYQAIPELSQTSVKMKFAPVDNCIQEMDEGERIAVEVLEKATLQSALIPLAAVSSKNEVWIVENGHVWPVEIDISERNEYYVSLPEEWSGKTVVLLPDSCALTPGCVVKEQKE